MNTATILLLLIATAYLFGSFLAIRREHGVVTMTLVAKHRNITAARLVREILATSGANLAHADRFLLFVAYLLIAIVVAVAIYGVGLNLLAGPQR